MKMSKRKRRYWIQGGLTMIAGLFFLMPVFLIVMNSFKPYSEIMLSFISPPKSLYLDNFKEAARLMNFATAFGCLWDFPSGRKAVKWSVPIFCPGAAGVHAYCNGIHIGYLYETPYE